MTLSKITKKYKNGYIITNSLSALVTVGPLAYYLVKALIEGSTQEKLVLGMMVFAALALTAVNILFKYSLRSAIWLAILGIYTCLNDIQTLLIVIAITTILDEFVLSPLAKGYKEKYHINKEIDKRE